MAVGAEVAAESLSAVVKPVISEIPIDLFIFRKRDGLTRGDLTFSDGGGNLIYSLGGDRSSKTGGKPAAVVHLLDAKGNSVISISRKDGCWQGCRGDGEALMFNAKRTLQSFRRREVEVFLFGDSSGDFVSVLKIRGCPFKRSCTIYQDNSIVAQTNLMYKLRKIRVGRRRFRLTIFPGILDHGLLVALIVTFFHGSI